MVETRTARLWLDEDGILRLVFHPKAELTRADAEENHAAIMRLTGSQHDSTPQLVDISRIKSADRGARTFSASDGAATLAVALIVGSPVSRVIGNFYLGLNSPKYPLRLFTSEREAIEWLKGFQK